jgi:phosphate transport system permease protein
MIDHCLIDLRRSMGQVTTDRRKSSYTGRQRTRTTKPYIRLLDSFAKIIISFGGIGTILSVGMVFVFLFSVVVPLFFKSSATKLDSQAFSVVEQSSAPAKIGSQSMGLNDYHTMGWFLDDSGSIASFNAVSGHVLERRQIFPEQHPSVYSVDPIRGSLAVGFENGSIVLGEIRFANEFISVEALPEELIEQFKQATSDNASLEFRNGLIQKVDDSQFRLQALEVKLNEPLIIENESAILLIDQTIRPNGLTIAALTESGQFLVQRVEQKKNLLTGKTVSKLTGGSLQLTPEQLKHGTPASLKLSGIADTAYLVWKDGHLLRLDTRNLNAPVVAEQLELLAQAEAEITSVEFLIGKTSLAVGDSLGRVRIWFRIKPQDATTSDGSMLVMTRELASADSRVNSLSASSRTRMLAAAYQDGSVRLFHATSGEMLVNDTSLKHPLSIVSISPKDDALYGAGDGKLFRWNLSLGYPAVSVKTIFSPVWYEGYQAPAHVWQSSSGTDDFEEKYGLMPLIFGTIKATFYSMLFGVPLALLAAIYTSEFLRPRVKAKIKPTIEMMASLPSVVLGFLAALVIAPLVEDVVVQILCAFLTIPFCVLSGAYLWQMCSKEFALRYKEYRPLFILLAIALGLGLCSLIGGPVEALLFAGDIRSWLDGQVGTATGGLLILFIPLSAFFVAAVFSRLGRKRLTKLGNSVERGAARTKLAKADFIHFLLASAGTIILALLLSYLFSKLGFDPRGNYLDTYVQRNALVVGFVMGFAIIPIIYTIADDALSSVPEHLRAASLGCGATHWQTAIRIIIPTAMSGLFSAIMIGLGRAVGETMIVLMAAGNTPVMEWNIFNGFRTLSANIAVELPEAVQGGTHYRMLFLAALCLFVLTFVLNTAAEIIRLRFRKRAYQL